MPESHKTLQSQTTGDWIGLQIHRAVQAIAPPQPEGVAVERMLTAYRRHYRFYRLKRVFGFSCISGSGIAVAITSWADIEWAELIQTLFEWFSRPLALKFTQSFAAFMDLLG